MLQLAKDMAKGISALAALLVTAFGVVHRRFEALSHAALYRLDARETRSRTASSTSSLEKGFVMYRFTPASSA